MAAQEGAELRIEAASDPCALLNEIGVVVVVGYLEAITSARSGPHLLGDDYVWPDAVEDLGQMSGVGHAVEEVRRHQPETSNHGPGMAMGRAGDTPHPTQTHNRSASALSTSFSCGIFVGKNNSCQVRCGWIRVDFRRSWLTRGPLPLGITSRLVRRTY